LADALYGKQSAGHVPAFIVSGAAVLPGGGSGPGLCPLDPRLLPGRHFHLPDTASGGWAGACRLRRAPSRV